MTTYNHTAIPSSPNQEAAASVINSPLGELDAAIGDLSTLGTTERGSIVAAIGSAALRTRATNKLAPAINSVYDDAVAAQATADAAQAEITAARDSYASLDARLDAMIVAGGNIATLTNGAASAAQKVVTVDSTTGFVAGAYVAYTLVGGALEYNSIDTVDSGTQLTLDTNIGTGGIANDTYISMVSPAEYLRLHGLYGEWYVDAYGAKGDGVTDDTTAIQAAMDAASAAGGGIVLFSGSKSYYLAGTDGGVTVPSNTIVIGNGATIYTDMEATDDDAGYRCFNLANSTTNVEISGLIFLGDNDPFSAAASPDHAAIYALGTGVTDVNIHHCTFKNLFGFSVHVAASALRVHVNDCHMIECSNGLNVNAEYSQQCRNVMYYSEGIECSGAYAKIADNVIRYATIAGISVGGTTSPGDTVVGQNVTGNVIFDAVDKGISINDGCEGLTVANNTVVRSQKSGIQVSGAGTNAIKTLLIANNNLRSCGLTAGSEKYGILVNGTLVDGVKIHSNYIYNNSDDTGYATTYGIACDAADDVDIAENTVEASSKTIALNGTTNVTLGRNRLDYSKVEFINSVTFAALNYSTPTYTKQPLTDGSKPVITVEQADVSEEFIRFIGTSTTDNSQSLIDAANLGTPGAIVGWLKIYVQDDQGTGPITDGVYWIPFYATPTA